MAKDATVETKTKAPKSAKSAKPDKPNFFARTAQYFRDVRAEMKRVVWPSRQEVINSSLVVIVTLIFFVAFTFVVDAIASRVILAIGRIG